LAAVDFYLETIVINSYLSFIQKKLKEPIRLYRKIFDALLEPYSYSQSNVSVNNSEYAKLADQVQRYSNSYNTVAQARLTLLNKAISGQNLSNQSYMQNTKLNGHDLAILVTETKKNAASPIRDLNLGVSREKSQKPLSRGVR
jgi:hypothetical protein